MGVMPKICVPLVGTTLAEIREEVQAIDFSVVDMMEWRSDFFSEVASIPKLVGQVRELVGNKTLLFTYRTESEGGAGNLSASAYASLVEEVMQTGHVDMVDVEWIFPEEIVGKLLELARKQQVATILSYHDMESTKSKKALLTLVRSMASYQTDFVKLATMTQNLQDTATLLSVAGDRAGEIPLILIGMGEYGIVTRLLGELFQSPITFVSGKHASAKGQLPASDVKALLQQMLCYSTYLTKLHEKRLFC